MHDITVTLLDKAWDQLRDDAAMLEMSKTDTLNRAIQVQHALLRDVVSGSRVVLVRPDGTTHEWMPDGLLGIDTPHESAP